jgi:F-type H+-transporting ATPase subunit b
VAAAQEEGIAALGFNLPSLISNLINFVILLVLLRLFLYRPVLKLLDERRKRIADGLENAAQATSAAAASEADAKAAAVQAQQQARESVQQAQEAAGRLREQLEADARRDAEQIVARAREEMRIERDQAIGQLRQEFADLTIAAAERVTGQALDRQAHQRLIDETLVSSDFGSGS